MAGPVDAIAMMHNAFRHDMSRIDAAALGLARGKAEPGPELERSRFFSDVLVWHARGEELGIFPALELVAPSVAEAYIRDHKGLDAATERLNAAMSAHDSLETARAAAALKFHLDIHLDKEDAHLYRLIRERVSIPDQIKASLKLSTAIPPERHFEADKWLFSLLDNDDREKLLRAWQMVLTPRFLATLIPIVRPTIGGDWPDLVRRMPELGSA